MSSEDYRFGFNGKENDNEVKGKGNQQDFGRRIYDNRFAKFLSIDPLHKETPNQSTYNFAGNSPILFIDKEGAFKLAISERAKNDGVTLQQVTRYQKLLENLSQFTLDNPAVVQAISDQSGLTPQQILHATEWGRGPTISIESPNDPQTSTANMWVENNNFDVSNLDNNVIHSGFQQLQYLNNIDKSSDQEMYLMTAYLAYTTLHELVHIGDMFKNNGKSTGSFNDQGILIKGKQKEHFLSLYPVNFDRGDAMEFKILKMYPYRMTNSHIPGLVDRVQTVKFQKALENINQTAKEILDNLMCGEANESK